MPGDLHELTGCTDIDVLPRTAIPGQPAFHGVRLRILHDRLPQPGGVRVVPGARRPRQRSARPDQQHAFHGRRAAQALSRTGPTFVPAGEWQVVDRQLDHRDRRHARSTGSCATDSAELNVDFCAAIPVLTITGSFGVPIEQALDIRQALATDPQKVVDILKPVIAARRAEPKDDLISILVQAELTDDDGVTDRLTDREIDSFVLLLLGAGSGTTWKQMGITLTALLQRPELLEAVRADRQLLRPAIEEAIRWLPTDPMFSRWVMADTELGGVEIPAGSVVHLAIGAANRDPARWDRPDEYDITRKFRPSLGFGQGAHICLGMHVARAEMTIAISALLDRLPNLRLDPDAEPPRFVGMYERGATAIPVLFDKGTR